MTSYETVIILNPALSDEEATAIFDNLQEHLIQDAGVDVVATDAWGRRKFAYEVNKKKEGIYHVYRYTRDNSETSIDFTEFERRLRFNENVWRFVTIRIPESEVKKPILRPEVYTGPVQRSPRPYGPRSDRPGPPPARSAAGADEEGKETADESQTETPAVAAVETPAADAPTPVADEATPAESKE